MQIPTHKKKMLPENLLFGGILILLFACSFYSGISMSASKTPDTKDIPKTSPETALKIKRYCNNYKEHKFRGIYDCYSENFLQLTKNRGVDFALDTVDEFKKIDKDAKSSCHPIGHAIGWGVYDQDPKHWKENIRKMPAECNYGIHMGMIERFTASNGGVLDKATIKSICNESGGCNHGIGHVALVVTDNNIKEALDLCSVLPNNFDQRHWCYTGVFMERRTMQNLAEHIPVKKERLDNWAYLLEDYMNECANYKDEVYIACWSGLALPASISFDNDPIKIFDVCNKSTIHEASNKCRREAVNYIAEGNVDDLPSQGYICSMGPKYDPEFAKDCHSRIVSNGMFILDPQDLNKMVDYCNSVDKTYREKCFTYIHYGLSDLRKPVDSEKVCKNALPQYKEICLGTN